MFPQVLFASGFVFATVLQLIWRMQGQAIMNWNATLLYDCAAWQRWSKDQPLSGVLLIMLNRKERCLWVTLQAWYYYYYNILFRIITSLYEQTSTSCSDICLLWNYNLKSYFRQNILRQKCNVWIHHPYWWPRGLIFRICLSLLFDM